MAKFPTRTVKYLGHFNAALDGPAGAFSLTSPFAGDLTKIYLQQIQLAAGQGKAEGHLNLQFANGIAWDTALDLSAINPAYWVAELPGTLAGPLRSQGEIKDEKLSLSADLDLKGKLRGQPAVIQAKANGGGEQWNLDACRSAWATTASAARAACNRSSPGRSISSCRVWPSSGRNCAAAQWPDRCRRYAQGTARQALQGTSWRSPTIGCKA
jgi:translocation and assembly module TamB